ncbi:MAG TPA: tetratricopeptide repeat protein, partial [Myxococcota bacterium]
PAPLDDPFDRTGVTGSSSQADPFAKLDLDGTGPRGSASKAEPRAAARWHVKTRAGMDADVDLPQLREMVKTGTVSIDDEAAPAGDALKPVSAWPILLPQKTAPKKARVSGVGARSGPSFRTIAIAVAVVVVVGGGLGTYLVKPELFERTTDAGVNPLRRAKPSWEKQFPDVNGTAAEHMNAGKAQMRLDTAAGYRKADDELRQALLLDIGNVGAIAAWVENLTNLPAVKADLETAQLAGEAVAYARKKAPDSVDVQRADGALKLALGEVDLAQKVLTQAHTNAPASADTTLVLAQSYLERNAQDAFDLVQEVRTKDPQLKKALVVEGAAQRRLGAFKEARDVLGARLIDDPTNTGALKELAKLELDVGNPEQAIQALTKLLTGEDRDVEAHLMRAKIAYQMFDGPDALKRADGFLDTVIKSHDTSAGELLLPVLAHAAFVKAELGNLDDALKLAERARTTDSSYAPALFVLGRIYALKGNINEAKKVLESAERAAQAHTQDVFYDPVVRAELARVLSQSGDTQSAAREYEHVLADDPRYTRAHFGLAATYMATDHATQAMTIMRRAYENDPAYEAEHRVLTDYPTSKHDLLAFADAFKNAKVPAGDESLAALKLASEAMIRYAAGQNAEAEVLCKRTLVEDRFNDVALLTLGVIDLNDGRVQEAKRYLRLAADTTGKNHHPTALYLARAEARSGELDDAKKRIQDLVDQEPTLVAAQYTQAMLLRQQHLEAQATEQLKKVLKADPDYQPAKRALSEAQ